MNRGGTVLFCGVSQGLGRVFVDSRLLRDVKEEDLFFAENQLLQSTYKAIERARFLSGLADS